jgi:hypothetical protein
VAKKWHGERLQRANASPRSQGDYRVAGAVNIIQELCLDDLLKMMLA